MSGIAGLVELNGGPAPAEVLAAMSDAIAHMGPDSSRTWQDGPAGLVYAHLQTTDHPPSALQPHSLDDQIWLVADARIDDQAELRRRLEAAGQAPAQQASDADLILHAYHAWSDGCLDHLIGDFAFALWDGPRRRLLCARDPLGLRPFFYARAGRLLAFGSHLDAIRALPGLSTDLDDQAIADFLLFGLHQEAEATPFRHIRRLPPAHALVLEDGEVAIRCYWSPPIDEPLRLAQREDYIERFLAVFEAAVADRLRATRVGIHMSGGLDSTSVAATALAVARQANQPLDLRAFVVVYDRLIPDVERSWTTAAASRMGIPLEILVADDYQAYSGCLDGGPQPAEPSEDTVPELSADLARMAARHSPIVLTGQGGDVIFYPERDYLLSELRRLRLGRVLGEVAVYRCLHSRWPPLYLRSALRRRLGLERTPPATVLEWLNPDLVARLDLPSRWRAYADVPPGPHPLRPEAYGQIFSHQWSSIMEEYAHTSPGQPVLEYRHPFLDLRVIRFLLRVPPLPWCVQKELLREAMRGRLPEPIRRRPKMALAGNPIHRPVSALTAERWNQILSDPAAQPYLSAQCPSPPPPTVHPGPSQPDHHGVERLFGLAQWLMYHHRSLAPAYQSTGTHGESRQPEDGLGGRDSSSGTPSQLRERTLSVTDEKNRTEYNRPQVRYYGDLGALTKATAGGSAGDGGKGAMTSMTAGSGILYDFTDYGTTE